MITKTLAGVLFKDDVNRADSDDPGPDYTEELGDWDVVSNGLQTTTGTAILSIAITPQQNVFIQSTASGSLTFGHNPGLLVKFVSDGGGRDFYEFRYDSGFGNIRMYRVTNSGGPVQLGGVGPGGGTTSGAGHMQFWVNGDQLKGRFWDGGGWKTMTRTDANFQAISALVGLIARTASGTVTKRQDNPIVMKDPYFRTAYAGAVAPGWKAQVLSSALSQVVVATNASGVALPDVTTVTPSIPQAGWPVIRILDTDSRAIDELEGAHYPGEEFSWDGAAKFYQPTLTIQSSPTGLGRFTVTAAEHIEGVTTEAEFGEGNDLPYPKYLYTRIALAATPDTIVAEIENPGAILTLEQLVEGLAPGTYVVRSAWFDGKYNQLGVLSARYTMVIAAEVTEPSDEEEGVTYNVSSANCAQLTVELEPWAGAGTEIGIWWMMGTRDDAGTTFAGRHSEVAMIGNYHDRSFPLLERGRRNIVGWRRIINVGGQWRLTIEHRVNLDACDDVPAPFMVTPPGKTYDADFTFQWEYRGPVDFWTGNSYTHRIERSADLGANWTLVDEDHVGLSKLTDWFAGLADGLHLIRVTTKSADAESGPVFFGFYKGNPADSIEEDFKAAAGLPAGGTKWAGAGTGTDRTTWAHVPGLGVTAKRDVQNPIDHQPSVYGLEAFGLPRTMRGILTFSARVPNESWSGDANRFGPMLFQMLGLGFCVAGTGADKSAWHGILLRQASNWFHGWGYSGHERAATPTGSEGGVNMEFNRVNFGTIGPYIYGICSDLKTRLTTKRVGQTTFGDIGAGTAVVASRWFPTNRQHGQQTFIYAFELLRVTGGYELKYLIAGPGANPSGWDKEGLVVSDGASAEIPCGEVALVFNGPLPAGEAVFHSLVGEVSDDCADECPPFVGGPSILEITADNQARTITVRGNQPNPNDEGTLVRYRIFAQGDYDEALDDTGWVVWSDAGVEFGPFDAELGCFVIEYAWADPCGLVVPAPLGQATLPSNGGC